MRSNKFISGICIVGFTALVVIMATRRNEERASVNPVEAEAERAETVDHSPPPPPGPTPAYAGVIAKNTSFFDLLTACGVTPQDINTIASNAKPVYNFRRVYPGQSYECYTDSVGYIERRRA